MHRYRVMLGRSDQMNAAVHKAARGGPLSRQQSASAAAGSCCCQHHDLATALSYAARLRCCTAGPTVIPTGIAASSCACTGLLLLLLLPLLLLLVLCLCEAHQAAAVNADDGVVLCLGVVHGSSRGDAPAEALSVCCVQVSITTSGLQRKTGSRGRKRRRVKGRTASGSMSAVPQGSVWSARVSCRKKIMSAPAVCNLNCGGMDIVFRWRSQQGLLGQDTAGLIWDAQ